MKHLPHVLVSNRNAHYLEPLIMEPGDWTIRYEERRDYGPNDSDNGVWTWYKTVHSEEEAILKVREFNSYADIQKKDSIFSNDPLNVYVMGSARRNEKICSLT